MIRRHVGYVLTTVVGVALLFASGCGTENGNPNVPPNEKDETAYGAEAQQNACSRQTTGLRLNCLRT